MLTNTHTWLVSWLCVLTRVMVWRQHIFFRQSKWMVFSKPRSSLLQTVRLGHWIQTTCFPHNWHTLWLVMSQVKSSKGKSYVRWSQVTSSFRSCPSNYESTESGVERRGSGSVTDVSGQFSKLFWEKKMTKDGFAQQEWLKDFSFYST